MLIFQRRGIVFFSNHKAFDFSKKGIVFFSNCMAIDFFKGGPRQGKENYIARYGRVLLFYFSTHPTDGDFSLGR